MSEISGYYTALEAAQKIGVSRAQVTRYIQANLLSDFRIGQNILVPKKEVDSFTPPPKGNPNFRNRKQLRQSRKKR